MVGKRMLDEINEQIKLELESAYIYLAMSAAMSDQGWDGMASWLEKQAGEEVAHAMKFYKHLIERGARVELHAIAKPQKEWSSPLAAFKGAYEHEKFVTGRINHMMEVAREEKDNPAQSLLQWFVDEQVEEEDQTLKVVTALEKIGDSTGALFMLDHNLGKRGDD